MQIGLEGFSEATRSWFADAFSAPTDAQIGTWQAVRRGEHVLTVAPTGSGKTLAAFLASVDRLATIPRDEDKPRCRVLYVSPLKALAVDVQRNLRTPLTGIGRAAARLRLPEPDVTVAMRTGDTPANERRAFAKNGADILITTPESLFLLLTSNAREALAGVETVIVDEVHAMAGGKRGVHLAVSLERLDALLERPAQRIGLSATVRPVEEVARFLGGSQPVTVVQPPARKTVRLDVVVPVEDMAEMSTVQPNPGDLGDEVESKSIWPAIEERVYELIRAHRSTIVFTNGRRAAERLTSRLNDLAEENPQPLKHFPAMAVGQSGVGKGAPPVIAKAHHGSVSKEQRRIVEEDLKAGRLPAVVATSSLELGIDMGAVDLVIQVEAPPSVASGLQRVGRAGHQVGAVSTGVILPKYRGDLVSCAVVAERMTDGAIEELHCPRNPLDVLAQQIVAIVSMDESTVDDIEALVRRAAPYAELPRSALEATLDMLAGRYPSDAFAELRPRLTWDRVTGILTARPGAQRLAVTSGGTIPDRGLFGVFLAGEKGSRVGELDEEMVYESRVGDVFLLGSSSWQIQDITPDKVIVTPAPGQPGRMPFWKGDTPGRPLELGRAVGAFVREMTSTTEPKAIARAKTAGLDDWAATNLLSYLADQREAAGTLPDDHTIVVERFTDELGDWRICLHSPFGAPVNSPWALALTARLRERYGIDGHAVASDDGIVLRLPDMETPPPADVVVFSPEEIEEVVTAELGGSAVFAARFRECAARSLLLPRRRPGRRAPLWQQRQRAAQLLAVAGEYGEFPVVLEAMRECLNDVFDLPGLTALMREMENRTTRVVEAPTAQPSPFARSLLFGYVGAFMYEGDAPLAEQRAQALALDTTLLAELLGRAELRELLDPDVLAETVRQIQYLTEERRASTVDDVADLLRLLGGLSAAEIAERGGRREWVDELVAARRAIRVRIAGEGRWIAIEDAGRVRDALGVALPVGVPDVFTEPVADPLGDLVSRYARTHGPFTSAAVAERFGIGVAVAASALQRLASAGRLTAGEFTPGGAGAEWCDTEVLRMLRRRSLAVLRAEVEPVPPAALGAFLPAWQRVGPHRPSGGGVDALADAIATLQGVPLPASALESLILPARVPHYSPALLDELCTAGEVLWAGNGSLPGNDGWIALAFADTAPLLLPEFADPPEGELHTAVTDALAGGQALFFRDISDRVAAALGAVPDDEKLVSAIWDLVWTGRLSNDTLGPLRTLLGAGRTSHRPSTSSARQGFRRASRRPRLPSRTGPPTVAGRWSLLPERESEPTLRAHATTDALLERYGVVTKGPVTSEGVSGGFARIYSVLSALEDAGRVRRGYFVEGLGGAQFAVPGAVDRLRAIAGDLQRNQDARRDLLPTSARRPDQGPRALVLAATDPANPYGAALPWPDRSEDSVGGTTHRPGRKAGALVVLVDGALTLYVERGGRTLLSFTAEVEALTAATLALAGAVRDGMLGSLSVQKADGAAVMESPLADLLEQAGFRPTPRGLRLRN
ncbi:ATP-dependent helicase [Fodinicola acaciae]|uniref:ATP-dependent helicase n=1 Tax=Fodinicola acaciae TaxID=2681555 RepID=UPI0013D00022|nr:ATP-dependent helicase [Fodinicola acaciae]